MRLNISQELRQDQRQTQIMTQRLIQSMKILQLSLHQLEEKIDTELEQNPVLELTSEPSAETKEKTADTDSVDDYDDNNDNFSRKEEHEPEIKFDYAGEQSSATTEFNIADEYSQNYSDTIDEAPVRSQNWLEDQETMRADAFANIECPGESLQGFLEQQLNWFDGISEPLREMALRIINNLNDRGYFTYKLEGPFESEEKNFFGEAPTEEELALAKEALALVKQLEPRGVGGKDIEECLLLQIDPESEYAEVLRVLITTCLKDISLNRMHVIAKKINFSPEIIQGGIAELRHFKPAPSFGFGGYKAAVVVPDVFVEQTEKGEYIVRLEFGRSTQLRVSKYYRDLMDKHETDKETKTYIRQKVDSARWLISAIEQRRETLLKVSQAIVDHQTEFFAKGQQALKPLKMQQIAEVVNMHVTTVSRACNDKWISSPQGVFPLRDLFSCGLSKSDGEEAVANDAVRSKLQEFINKENKKEPLSDDAIVKMFEAEGIHVARRTVAKYRELLEIPSSRGRRQWET